MTREEILKKLKASNKNTESELELAAMLVFDELGWEVIYAEHEMDGDETILGRTHHGEVILERYLLPALKDLNIDLPEEALKLSIQQLTRDISTKTLARANQDIYTLLKNGAKVDYRDKDGNQQSERVRFIDWDTPSNNHFLLVSQMWIKGPLHSKRPDLLGFINGIPLLFMELKAPDKKLKSAFNDNLRDYKDTITHLMWYNGIVLLSNGQQAKAGSLTAEWEHFADWKKINDVGEVGISIGTKEFPSCNYNPSKFILDELKIN